MGFPTPSIVIFRDRLMVMVEYSTMLDNTLIVTDGDARLPRTYPILLQGFPLVDPQERELAPLPLTYTRAENQMCQYDSTYQGVEKLQEKMCLCCGRY